MTRAETGQLALDDAAIEQRLAETRRALEGQRPRPVRFEDTRDTDRGPRR